MAAWSSSVLKRRVRGHFDPAAFEHPGRRLILLLKEVETAQELAKTKRQEIRQHIADNPALKPLWDDFQERGGSTAQELSAWLTNDDWLRKDQLLRWKHLRLVHTREPVVQRKQRIKLPVTTRKAKRS